MIGKICEIGDFVAISDRTEIAEITEPGVTRAVGILGLYPPFNSRQHGYDVESSSFERKSAIRHALRTSGMLDAIDDVVVAHLGTVNQFHSAVVNGTGALAIRTNDMAGPSPHDMEVIQSLAGEEVVSIRTAHRPGAINLV